MKNVLVYDTPTIVRNIVLSFKFFSPEIELYGILPLDWYGINEDNYDLLLIEPWLEECEEMDRHKKNMSINQFKNTNAYRLIMEVNKAKKPVIITSTYSKEEIMDLGLIEGLHYIQNFVKPFCSLKLEAKVREVLGLQLHPNLMQCLQCNV